MSANVICGILMFGITFSVSRVTSVTADRTLSSAPHADGLWWAAQPSD